MSDLKPLREALAGIKPDPEQPWAVIGGAAFWDFWNAIPHDDRPTIMGLAMWAYQCRQPEIDALAKSNAELLEALKFYAEIAKYEAPFTGGMGDLWADCGHIARAAITNAERKDGV